MEYKGEIPVTLTRKNNMVDEVTLVEEDLTKEVEVEKEANELSIGATNETSWGINHLNVQGRQT